VRTGGDGPTHLRVFLSSPGDVASERAIARSVIEQLQYDPFVRGRVTFDVVAWDRPGGGVFSASDRWPVFDTITKKIDQASDHAAIWANINLQ
jgi:hypothetical protein